MNDLLGRLWIRRKMFPTWFGIAGALLMIGILVGDKPKEPVNIYIKKIYL